MRTFFLLTVFILLILAWIVENALYRKVSRENIKLQEKNVALELLIKKCANGESKLGQFINQYN